MSRQDFLNRINPTGAAAQSKAKIIFYGDSPTAATGFGQVSRNIVPALHASGRYEVEVLGVNYWGNPHSYPFNIWPMAINPDNDPYGRKKMIKMLAHPQFNFDILFFLQDTFILHQMPEMLAAIKKSGKQFKSIFYYPIDGTPKENWIKAVDAVDYPVTYSQFGFEESVKFFPGLKDRLQILPHGADPKIFHQVDPAQALDFRKNYFKSLADKFIIMNVNRNQQRKDIPATIRAFAEFKKHRPDSVLYLHMAAVDVGGNLPEMIKAFGLDLTTDVILPHNFTPSTGFPLPILNLLYNSCDCLVSTTIGEGWGLSWTESMLVKKPVVFPANTCLTQYITEDTGYPYRSGLDMDHLTIIPNDNEVVRPLAHINHLVERLIEVHDNPEEVKRRTDNAYKMVMENLLWDRNINPRWLEILDTAVAELRKPTAAADSGQVLRGELL